MNGRTLLKNASIEIVNTLFVSQDVTNTQMLITITDQVHWGTVDNLCARYTLALQGQLVEMDRRLQFALTKQQSDLATHSDGADSKKVTTVDKEIGRLRDLLVSHGDVHWIEDDDAGGGKSPLDTTTAKDDAPHQTTSDDPDVIINNSPLSDLTSLELVSANDVSATAISTPVQLERDALEQELRAAVEGLVGSNHSDETKRELLLGFIPITLLAEFGIPIPEFFQSHQRHPSHLTAEDPSPEDSCDATPLTGQLAPSMTRRHTRHPSLGNATIQGHTPHDAPWTLLRTPIADTPLDAPPQTAPPILAISDEPTATILPPPTLRFAGDSLSSNLTRLPGGRALGFDETSFYFSLTTRKLDRQRLAAAAEKGLQQLRKERLALISSVSQFGSHSGGERLQRLEQIQKAEGLVAKAEEVCNAMDAEALEFQEHKASMLRLANTELKAANAQYDAQTTRITNAESYLAFLVDREMDALRVHNDPVGSIASSASPDRDAFNKPKPPSYEDAAFMRSKAYCTASGVWKADVTLQVKDVADHTHASTMKLLARMKDREELLNTEMATISDIVRQASECDKLLDAFIACPKCKKVTTDMYAMWPCGHAHCGSCVRKAQQQLNNYKIPTSRMKAAPHKLTPPTPLHRTEEKVDTPKVEEQSEVATLLSHLLPQNHSTPADTVANRWELPAEAEDILVYRCPTCGDHSPTAPVPHVLLNNVSGRLRFHRSGYEDLNVGLER